MSHCQCEGIERRFDHQRVTSELADLRKDGPPAMTRRLIAALQSEHLDGLTLLDIGSGLGAIPQALLPSGIAFATDVDASEAYLSIARQEAERLGVAERMSFIHGNFVEVASTTPVADVVTLDRVICCYDDMPALVTASANRARRFYGIIIPREVWWMRLFSGMSAILFKLKRSPMRFYLHAITAIDAAVRSAGLTRHFTYAAGSWQLIIYARV
jgi:magnesium-protoporphyrin O-methyltransferase